MHDVPKPDPRRAELRPHPSDDDATAVKATQSPRGKLASQGHPNRSPRKVPPRAEERSEDDPSEAPTAVTARAATARSEGPRGAVVAKGAPVHETSPAITSAEESARPIAPCAMEPTTWIEQEPATNVRDRARQVPKTVRVDVVGLGDGATARAVKLPDLSETPAPVAINDVTITLDTVAMVERTDPMRVAPPRQSSSSQPVPPIALWGVAVILGVTAAVVTEIALVLAR